MPAPAPVRASPNTIQTHGDIRARPAGSGGTGVAVRATPDGGGGGVCPGAAVRAEAGCPVAAEGSGGTAAPPGEVGAGGDGAGLPPAGVAAGADGPVGTGD